MKFSECLLLALGGVLIALMLFIRATAGQISAAPTPAPHHTEWGSHDVSGYILCSPDSTDSTGVGDCIILPQGTQLSWPIEVGGFDPDNKDASKQGR